MGLRIAVLPAGLNRTVITAPTVAPEAVTVASAALPSGQPHGAVLVAYVVEGATVAGTV